MSIFTHIYNPDQLPPDELSEREKQLLKTHLNRERAVRWKQLAGPKPTRLQTFLEDKKWIWMVVAALLGVAAIAWQAGWFSAPATNQSPAIAARADLIAYPFDNIAVRGEHDLQGFARPVKALEAYQKNDFGRAIQESSPSDHFFMGICWLQLKQPQKALAAFDQVATFSDEFFLLQRGGATGFGALRGIKNLISTGIGQQNFARTIPFRSG